jgi:dihydrofolate synthase / folylpolyglutamate synthase
MYPSTLQEWTNWIKSLHVTEMDLSLERVREIAHRLNILKPPHPVITVGGTNGKGSTVAGLEAIYLRQGYKVGAFTTPFLFKPNEQIRINGEDVTDESFCEAYKTIEGIREGITLTPFEFNALAALLLFSQANLDVVILEVGLGGRWDAVNVIDADVAIITSIAIDHVEWLGNTRESIAREKSGIFRANKPVVCGDVAPPAILMKTANDINAPFFCQNKDFGYKKNFSSDTWSWWSGNNSYDNLPKPRLALQNIATVLKAIELMQLYLPVSFQTIREGLPYVSLAGRIQLFPGRVPHLFDVSHNPASAEFLANWLKENPVQGKVHAVFSMLADKDMLSTLLMIKECINAWYIGPINEPRGASLEFLQASFYKAGIAELKSFLTLEAAYKAALKITNKQDIIVIFGSFRTVAEVAKVSTIFTKNISEYPLLDDTLRV